MLSLWGDMMVKIKICRLPCMYAIIKEDILTGNIRAKCPKNCIMATYEDKEGPIDKFLRGI